MIETNSIIIRQANSNDALAIKQVHNTAYQISYRGYLPDEFLDTLTINEDIIQRTQKYLTQTECYVALINGKVIGFMYVCYPEDKTFEIQALYIHPTYQKQGAGTALIQNLWKIKTKGVYKKCVVWTMKLGPSLPFYKKMGFSLTTSEKKWKFDIPLIMLEKNF